MINRKFKKCLITGITGSGGSYLAEHILTKDDKIKIFVFFLKNSKILKFKSRKTPNLENFVK